MDADSKVEAREMEVEGRTTSPLDQNNHFLLVQPNQRAYSRMVFPCALEGKGEDGHEVGARRVRLPVSVGVTATV